ncbi:Ig-like domain-containing protein [Acrocarpospora sp. B8E8]|uniref:Ig-like domain-containing protein n=1 Tax=Acrocarpospora sp. B8E8 TaxID=3153572 RepID=UPI00325C662B
MRIIQTALALGVAGVLLTACAGASGSTDTGAEGAPTVTVTSPKDGDTVNQPFTLTFTASVPIGPPDSGLNHVHIFTDGNTDDYTVVTTPTFTIKDLPAGRHTVGVTLQHADHSPAGASDEITVQVAGAPIGTPQETGGGGYGGGY